MFLTGSSPDGDGNKEDIATYFTGQYTEFSKFHRIYKS